MGLPSLNYIVNNEVALMAGKNLSNFASFISPPYATSRQTWLTAGLTPAGFPGPNFSDGSGFTCNSLTSGNLTSGFDTSGYLTYYNVSNLSNLGGNRMSTILCDRLWGATGFNLNTTGFQTVTNLETLPPRDIYNTSSGFGLEVHAEVSVGFNATIGNLLVNYKDAYGVDKTMTFIRTNTAYAAGQNLLIGGDINGISGITSFRFNSTGAGVGRLSLQILRRIHISNADDPLGNNVINGPLDTCLPIIYPSSCLCSLIVGPLVTLTLPSVYNIKLCQ